MLDMELRFEDGTVQTRCVALPLEIGREPKAGLYLKAWRVARRHALIEQHEGGVFIEDFGALSGTLVNGRRITRYGPLIVGDEIVNGHCLDRKSVVEGKSVSVSVDLGGRRGIKK